MTRLILFLFLIAAVAIALSSLATLTRAVGDLPPVAKGAPMPTVLKSVSFILLMILMLGITIGWIGAA
jgi:cell division protein FtsX